MTALTRREARAQTHSRTHVDVTTADGGGTRERMSGSIEASSSRRLKVAYLVNQYPHVSLTFIRREIRALEAQGVEIVRLSARRSEVGTIDPADGEELRRTTVLLERIPRLVVCVGRTAITRPIRFVRALREALVLGRRSDRGILRHLAYLAQACVVVEECEAQGVHHLHAHFGTNPAAVAVLSRLLGGPSFSLTIHGPEEFDRPVQWALDRKIRYADFVAAISEFTRSQLCRWADFQDWKKLHIVCCGLDHTFLDTPPSSVPDTRRLICVGRLCEQKGQMKLIEAAGQLKRSGIPFELLLVGDGPLRAVIEQRIQELGLQESVTLAGWQGGEWIRREILNSRAMVLPSFAEGLPVVLMEALALSRPVVTTFVAGIPELIEPGVNGWLVPAGSVSALAKAMEEVLSTRPEQLTAMGQAGACKVRARHSAATEATRLSGLLEQADSKHRIQTPGR
jgi:colanic acid/amylovoran biosynthesis glycosyltransferase